MTEIILNDDDQIDILNDGINDQTIIPNVVVIEPTSPSSLVKRDSIVIPSFSNSSISSVIQIETNNNNNNNNNNTLLPVCTSNSLGKLEADVLYF